LIFGERFITGSRVRLSGYPERPTALNGCVNKRRVAIDAGGFNSGHALDFIKDASVKIGDPGTTFISRKVTIPGAGQF
jgi:hypothetical protein